MTSADGGWDGLAGAETGTLANLTTADAVQIEETTPLAAVTGQTI